MIFRQKTSKTFYQKNLIFFELYIFDFLVKKKDQACTVKLLTTVNTWGKYHNDFYVCSL
jgi:hypothetical protein